VAQDVPKVAIQVWGEALRSPAVFERVREALDDIRVELTRRVEVYQAGA